MSPHLQKRAVAEARAWIGTPYRHQASVKGAGTDCLGLIRGIWRALYGAEPENIPAYTPDWSEASGQERLMEAALRHLVRVRIEGRVAGDIVVFRMRHGSVAKHLGLCASCDGRPTFIHAYSGHGVVESALSLPWERRIAAVFRFPEETV